MNKKAAHFLLYSGLWNSPPNDAISKSYARIGFDVDYFSPTASSEPDIKPVSYGIKWLLKNMLNPRWRVYDAYSCTSEDPIVIAAVIAFIWRKPLIFLSDEIKTASYAGDRPKYWKALCRWAMRRAELTIVNDQSRIQLQRDYAALNDTKPIIVYPGCFLELPIANDKQDLRKSWNIDNNALVLGFSGGCNLTAGIDWALESLDDLPDLHMIAQPLAMDSLSLYLLQNHRNAERIYLEKSRLSWQQSWQSMGGVDIGVAVYRNQAAQFQLMGISSNRLCMFLAMGVPVIVSKQKSFQFIEDYNCGVMVENAQQFSQAIKYIHNDLMAMKQNALRCAKEYIDTHGKFAELEKSMSSLIMSKEG